MEATNNNADTLFMDIFVELFAIAKVYFQELFKNADPGTYTIKDIYSFIEKNIEATKQGKLTGVSFYFLDRYVKTLKKSPYYTKVDSSEKYTISYFCHVADNVVSIEKGKFKCSFDIIKVFEYLERFKKLSGAKEKLKFTKETEIKEGQKSTFFEIELSREDIKSLTSVKTEKRDNCDNQSKNNLDTKNFRVVCGECFEPVCKNELYYNVLLETENNRMTIRTVVGKDIDVKIIGNSIEKTVNANINKIEEELYKFCIVKMNKRYKVGIKQGSVVAFTLDAKHRYEYRNICEAYLHLFEPSLSKTYKNHLDAIYKDTPKDGNYVEFNLSCNADAPTYTGFVSNDPGLGLVCVVDGQKIEVRKMINLKVLEPEESKTVSPVQNGEESSLNDKERSKAKRTKPTVQYTDDMLELVSLDLSSMTYVVNGDIGTAKNIQSIVLYDEIGKIVVSCDDGEKIECQFDGESILQSVLKEM